MLLDSNRSEGTQNCFILPMIHFCELNLSLWVILGMPTPCYYLLILVHGNILECRLSRVLREWNFWLKALKYCWCKCGVLSTRGEVLPACSKIDNYTPQGTKTASIGGLCTGVTPWCNCLWGNWSITQTWSHHHTRQSCLASRIYNIWSVSDYNICFHQNKKLRFLFQLRDNAGYWKCLFSKKLTI